MNASTKQDKASSDCAARIRLLLEGNLAQWLGLPENCGIDVIDSLYAVSPEGETGRLSGRFFTFRDFPAKDNLPAIRAWSEDDKVVRIDIEAPRLASPLPELLAQMGSPNVQRDPPEFYWYDESDTIVELVYAERGLTLHITDPSESDDDLPPRLVRIRAYAPITVSEFDRKLGGRDPKRVLRPHGGSSL